MELQINGNIIFKAIVKKENEEILYKIIETEEETIRYSVMETHIDNNKNEVLDFFDYMDEKKAEDYVNENCENYSKKGYEVIKESLVEKQSTLKHYIFSDDSGAITYEDDYEDIQGAEAFKNLLIKQFKKNFSYREA